MYFFWNGARWIQRGSILTPSDGESGDNFGYSVSLSADGLHAIIGANGDNVGSFRGQGSARVLFWNGDEWVQKGQPITANNDSRYFGYGHSVFISDDGLTAIIGGPNAL